jgi:hypothetical protein
MTNTNKTNTTDTLAIAALSVEGQKVVIRCALSNDPEIRAIARVLSTEAQYQMMRQIICAD